MNGIATFFRESRVARFLIPLGIILIVFSIFMFISDKHNEDYIATEATVSRTILVKEETFDIDGNVEPAEYSIYVKYTVDGTEYETELGQMYEHKIGQKIKIVYDPENPRNISQPASPILNVILLIGGIAAFIGGIVSAINAVKRHKKMKEQEASWENGN